MAQAGMKANVQVYKLVNYREASEKLRAAREASGESGAAVAAKAGMNQSQVSKLERGDQIFYTEPVKERVEKLAVHLMVSGLQWEPVDSVQPHKKPKPAKQKAPKAKPVVDSERLSVARMLLQGHKRGKLTEDEFLQMVLLMSGMSMAGGAA